MCLRTVSQTWGRDDPAVEGPIIAWKVFERIPKGGLGPDRDQIIMVTPYQTVEVEVGKPMEEVEERDLLSEGAGYPFKRYPIGFHAYATRKSGENLLQYAIGGGWQRPVLCKVELRGLRARGEEKILKRKDGSIKHVYVKATVLVATKMKVLEVVKGWAEKEGV